MNSFCPRSHQIFGDISLKMETFFFMIPFFVSKKGKIKNEEDFVKKLKFSKEC
jgi:hypothetical protein